MIEHSSHAQATRREQIGWCLYDFGNSAFATIIVTVVYGVYFTEVVAKEGGVTLWGRGVAASMAVVAFLSPFLGALADESGRKKSFLGGFTLVSIFFTALLYFVKEGDVVKGLLFFIIANIGFNVALIFYDAFLKELAADDRMGRLSAYGWATGYVGGFLSLLLVIPFIQNGFKEASFRFSFVITALFFLLFSLPLFISLKERCVRSRSLPATTYMKTGIHRIGETLKGIRQFKVLIRYFIAYFLYNEAINTIIVFSSIFSRQVLRFTPFEMITYFIVTQVSAAAGTFLFGPLTDKMGPKTTLSITLLGWMVIVFWAFWVETKAGFYGLGIVAGSILGTTQSASRTLLARFAPFQKSAEFFGFFSLTGKISASLGPLVYGEMARLTGSQRLATLSLNVFFIAGFLLLQTVDERSGTDAAKQWNDSQHVNRF